MRLFRRGLRGRVTALLVTLLLMYIYSSRLREALGLTHSALPDSQSNTSVGDLELNSASRWIRHWAIELRQQKKLSIMYNRVNKCASTFIAILMVHQRHKLNFTMESLVFNVGTLGLRRTFRWTTRNQTRVWLATEKESNLKVRQAQKNITHPGRAQVLHLHHAYFSDTLKQEVNPIYINVIRDPVARLYSEYHWKMKTDFKGSGVDWGLSFEECLQEGHPCYLSGDNQPLRLDDEKQYWWSPGTEILYMCGTDVRCALDRRWALQRALHNAVNNYLLIGVTEDLQGTVELLEFMLPEFFQGVLKKFLTSAKRNTGTYFPLAENMQRDMEEKMELDYVFYKAVETVHMQRVMYIRGLKAKGIENINQFLE